MMNAEIIAGAAEKVFAVKRALERVAEKHRSKSVRKELRQLREAALELWGKLYDLKFDDEIEDTD
jgi:hypothetical protein